MHLRKYDLFFRMDVRKMEALGTLAGGIAPDFNNLLMGIQGRTSLMLMDVEADRSQIEQVLFSLLFNSHDAMPRERR